MEEKKSGKKELIIIVFVLLVIAGLVYYFVDKSKKDKAYKEAVEHLTTKYNIEDDELSLVNVTLEHKVTACSQECIGNHNNATMPTYVRLKYNDKIITVINGKDDYLVQDLYEGIREYYASVLNLSRNKVFISIRDDSQSDDGWIDYIYRFNNYLLKYHITSIDDVSVRTFLNWLKKEDERIYIYLNASYDELDNFKNISNNLDSYEYLIVYDNTFNFTSSCTPGEYDAWGGYDPDDQMFLSCKINKPTSEFSLKYKPIFRKYDRIYY